MYETNADGLIERVIVENLHLKPTGRPRFKHDPNTPDKLPTGDAAHLIADVFDGSPELDNLLSQATVLNRGAGSKWTEMERAWRKALSSVRRCGEGHQTRHPAQQNRRPRASDHQGR
ncbi:DNA/RNA non-specific endonuclease [Rathayibacter iranicus]|uniref:Type VII secretion system protein EssD-like domain-containing protein n=1 Tax=Rathayibacter iranicus TaxID=59737 RepID=A0AAD1ACE7_9MICO|nr:hypothetical protein C7V51_06370 [Rathayibacter iranicus]MWV32544.1 hypothetical protein [Rathayibacter iranicus NCPPB 2253 = VKM Ac-1602]PPI60970.1 hypothetical protein C5E08_06350 [Rathayibacter iranicus]